MLHRRRWRELGVGQPCSSTCNLYNLKSEIWNLGCSYSEIWNLKSEIWNLLVQQIFLDLPSPSTGFLVSRLHGLLRRILLGQQISECRTCSSQNSGDTFNSTICRVFADCWNASAVCWSAWTWFANCSDCRCTLQIAVLQTGKQNSCVYKAEFLRQSSFRWDKLRFANWKLHEWPQRAACGVRGYFSSSTTSVPSAE